MARFKRHIGITLALPHRPRVLKACASILATERKGAVEVLPPASDDTSVDQGCHAALGNGAARAGKQRWWRACEFKYREK